MIDAKEDATKEDAAKLQRSKYQYYRYVEMERKLRKKISNAKIAQDQQRVEELWTKLREIRDKRKATEYYKLEVYPKIDKWK